MIILFWGYRTPSSNESQTAQALNDAKTASVKKNGENTPSRINPSGDLGPHDVIEVARHSHFDGRRIIGFRQLA
jgi:hypothetical protein